MDNRLLLWQGAVYYEKGDYEKAKYEKQEGKDEQKRGEKMEEKAMQVIETVKPNLITWISAALGAILVWWTGLSPLAQALLIIQGADIMTGLLCTFAGKSPKSESGRVSSGVLWMGIIKKGLEWLVVGVCVSVGSGLEMESLSGAAMTYMVGTELVSLMENLDAFGLKIPLLQRLLDIAQKKE